MANGYNPMQFITSLSSLAQQSGAQGKRWEGQQMGISRTAIQSFLNKRAAQAIKASKGLGIANLLSKPLGFGAQALVFAKTGSTNLARAAGASVAAATSKLGGEFATKDLDTSGIDMTNILYGRDAAEKAESTALTAINQLIERVNPSAIETAITTPLQYETLKNVFGKIPGPTTGAEKATTPVTDASVSQAMSKSTPVEFGYSDAVNPIQTNPGLIASEMSRVGSMASVPNVVDSQRKSFSSLLSYFLSGMKSNDDLSVMPGDPLEEELKMNPYQSQPYNIPGRGY